MTVSIFMIFFFNYGVMFLLAPIEIDIGPWNYISSGVYHDFNKEYYICIGPLIIQSQLFLSISPPITIFVTWLMRKVF